MEIFKFIYKKLFNVLIVIPFTLFITTAHTLNFTDTAWQLAFKYGLISSLIVLLITFVFKRPLDELVFPGLLYIILGGLGLKFNNSFIISFYTQYNETVYWIFLILFKLITIVSFPFIKNWFLIRPQNLNHQLVVFTAEFLITIWAFYHPNNLLLSVFCPFLLLKMLRAQLSHQEYLSEHFIGHNNL
ncbi:MAG: hypothetical protein JWM09_488 [Francisellaceae bacterium]|nr:hypothetical protein [Francisellaceae bacterium]